MKYASFLDKLMKKKQIATECEAAIQDVLSRCYSLAHAKRSLKALLEKIEVCQKTTHDKLQMQGLFRASVPFQLMLLRKRDAELYNRWANKLNRSLNGFCVGRNEGKTVLVHDIIFSGVELSKYNTQNHYIVLIMKNLYVAAQIDGDEYVYLGNRRWFDFPVKSMVIYGIDEDGLLTDCPYNEVTLNTLVLFRKG